METLPDEFANSSDEIDDDVCNIAG